jgi:hypothetical protein
MADQIITQEYLHKIFDYKDGNLYNKIKRNSRCKINSQVGCCFNKFGYKRVMILSKRYLYHHIIYFYHYGYLPKMIDHIDGNPKNNAIENLREANATENQYNRKINKNNTSGYKNVYLHKPTNQWKVLIRINGKQKFFGLYNDIDYAKFVADAMRHKHHGNFANNGH